VRAPLCQPKADCGTGSLNNANGEKQASFLRE
jgi:hypothetical protein